MPGHVLCRQEDLQQGRSALHVYWTAPPSLGERQTGEANGSIASPTPTRHLRAGGRQGPTVIYAQGALPAFPPPYGMNRNARRLRRSGRKVPSPSSGRSASSCIFTLVGAGNLGAGKIC